jgi:hypothetical protein
VKTATARRRALLALAVALLAAHLVLLQARPGAVAAPDTLSHRPMLTRTVSSVAAPATQPTPAPPALPDAPPAEPSRPVRPVRPVANTQRLVTPTPARTAEQPPAAMAVAAAAPASQSAAAAPPAGAPTARLSIPGSVRLHYRVEVHARQQLWQAAGELHWRHDGNSYEAKLELSAPLLPRRTQRSTGKITAAGLAPLRFSEKARSEEAAHFEHDSGKVSFSSNRPDAALLPGAQDRLSVMLQLGAMIAGEPAKFRPGMTIAIQTAGTRDAESWLFTVEGDEQLQLPGGAVNALKLTRSPRKEFDQRVELWLAPGMDYVPVRLRLTQANGDWVDQQWASTDKG